MLTPPEMVRAAVPSVYIALAVDPVTVGMVCWMQETALFPGAEPPPWMILSWSLHWFVVMVPVNFPVVLL